MQLGNRIQVAPIFKLNFVDSLPVPQRNSKVKMLFVDEIMEVENSEKNYFNGLDDLLDDDFQILK